MTTAGDLARTFSLEGYRALLEVLRAAGYRDATFLEPDPPQGHPALVLRHDLDVDPVLGVALAEIEADLGLRSTFFALVTSPLYNPAAPSARAALQRIVELGHEVGLHFDASPHATLEERDLALTDEVEVLGRIVGRPIRTASFHRPGVAAETPELPGLVSAYEPRFVEGLAYLADSGGSFRFSHPLDSEAFAQRRGIQLLTHPIWWTESPLGSVAERVDAWSARQQHRLRNTLAANIRPYAAHLDAGAAHQL